MDRVVFDWVRALCSDRLLAHGDASPRRSPLVVGVQGVHGSGKTALVRAVVQRLRGVGLSSVGLSLDDFHVPAAALLDADGHGNPGTHDLAALLETLAALRRHQPVVRVPIFDATLRDGRGDRAARERYVLCDGDTQVVLVEGWCVGFEGDEGGGGGVDPVDAHVRAYTALTRQLDALVLLPGTVQTVEEAIARGRRDGDTRRVELLARCLPAYARYLASLRCRPPVARTLVL